MCLSSTLRTSVIWILDQAFERLDVLSILELRRRHRHALVQRTHIAAQPERVVHLRGQLGQQRVQALDLAVQMRLIRRSERVRGDKGISMASCGVP